MGFNTTTLNAKLTPYGRKQLISTNNSLITSFALGDSDANYNTPALLGIGQVPAEAGEVGTNGSFSNSTTQNAGIKSFLVLNSNGQILKPVETNSSTINSDILFNGLTSVSGTNLTQFFINRNSITDGLVNLYYSFGLPLTANDDTRYTTTTYSNGGFSDTAISGLAQSNILVIAIKNNWYGETIDGKSLKVTLPTSAGTLNIFSTFQNKGLGLRVEDANIIETSSATSFIDSNIAFLFCDTINKPNGNAALSWGTGFGATKPFSVANKELYNLTTSSNLGLSADTAVGVAYLDKGFVVITHPDLVAGYTTSASTATTVTLNSVSTDVYQTVTCIADRGEFGSSTNPSFAGIDSPRITEVGLYDASNNLIAIAKTNKQITKNINEFMAMSIKISL